MAEDHAGPLGRTRIITRAEVAALLPMDECIDLMADTLRALARGEALMPERVFLTLPEQAGFLLVMPSALTAPRAIGLKALTLFPGNAGTRHPVIQGAMLLFEPEHGGLAAIVDAGEITALRTAAVSGAATRLLARPDGGDLALLGSGVQARTHLAAMRAVRSIRRVRVWSRTPEHARRFAEREAARHGIAIEPAETAEAAVRGADIVCTVTSSPAPVLRGAWLAPGAHVNVVGITGSPAHREVDTDAVARARVFVDRRGPALSEAGDLLIPIQEGAVGADHMRGELGEALLGRVAGRTAPEEITLFRSHGLAVEDAAAAWYVCQRAVERGVGIEVALGDGGA